MMHLQHGTLAAGIALACTILIFACSFLFGVHPFFPAESGQTRPWRKNQTGRFWIKHALGEVVGAAPGKLGVSVLLTVRERCQNPATIW